MSELTIREKELKKRQKALRRRPETSSGSSSSDDELISRKLEKKAARQVTAEKEHLVQTIYKQKLDDMRAEMLRKHFFSGS
jgi:cell pole-organizing protein PopZ